MRWDEDMTDSEPDDGPETALVPGAHRVVRVLDQAEGPFAGTLVTAGDGVAVRMDAGTLSGWEGWRCSGAEHVAAPIDVGRRTGGLDVLLPWCTDRVLGFLIRRAAAGAVLTPGECSTLVISLLRGLDEVGERIEATPSGVWWLTDGGRPVFVLGEGPGIRAGVEEIIGRLAADSPDKVVKRALGAVEQGLAKAASQPRLPARLLDAWENELLNVAAPRPLERGAPAPERAREVARATRRQEPTASQSASRLRADPRRPRDRRRRTGRVDAVGDAGRALLAVAVVRVAEIRSALLGRRSAARTADKDAPVTTHRRRRAVIVAGVAAAVVLAAGLLWPDGGSPGEAADGARQATPGVEPTHVATPGHDDVDAREESDEASPPPGPRTDDPVAAARALRRAIAACRAQGDSTCLAAVAPGSEGVVDALTTAERGEPAFELVDEYGGAAVVRLGVGDAGADHEADASGPVSLMMVLVRVEQKWLVRDVYDVADQPDDLSGQAPS